MARLSAKYPPTAIPTDRQLAYQDWEFGLFVHFGLYTFDEDKTNPDGTLFYKDEERLALFNPRELDCDQWIANAAQAGMRYAVLTTKHHDGFCLWPTKLTDFSVASTPWRGGTGDVVREFTDACRRHGVKVGLYYSPWDMNCPVYEDARAYDDFFIGQMKELLSDYGPIDILWFDGFGSQGHAFDWPRIAGAIRELQPDTLLFSMADPDIRWTGTEAGMAQRPLWNTAASIPISIKGDEEVHEEYKWLPVECDCTMRGPNWGYCSTDEHTIKALEQLMGLYYYSVGRGCNLLLNIGPDPRGLLPDADISRLREFGAEIHRRFGNEVAEFGESSEEDGTWVRSTEDMCKPALIDHVILQEDCANGEHVRRFAIFLWPENTSYYVKVYEGENIGHKAICRFPQMSAVKVKIEIVEADGPVNLRAFEVYNAGA